MRTWASPFLPLAIWFSLAVQPAIASGQAPETPPGAKAIDWPSLGREALGILADYLKVNTSNPPGNELEAAIFLKRILDREGIPAQILDTAELGPNRANLYARLKGNGSKRAVALVNHMDVVPVTPEYWTVDPFAGEIKNGYLYGRGALDMKGQGIMQLMAMIALKRSGAQLSRDLVFIGNADEELGSTGAQVLVDRHADLLSDVEFVLTEGAGNPVHNGKLSYFGVGVSEKRTFWHRLTVKGEASHGSRPTNKNPVPRLVAALYKLSQYDSPLHVTPAVARYMRDISGTYAGKERAWLADVEAALKDPAGRSWVLSEPGRNAMLRNTISLTVLNGSNKTNVIPAQASAEVDIRLLPDQDAAKVLAILKGVVNDTAVVWTPIVTPKPPLDNPTDNAMFSAIAQAAHDRDPNALVTTTMSTGGTDRPHYRRLGIVTYGFSPFKVDEGDSQKGVHGNDERLSVENVEFGVKLMYDVIRNVQ